MGVSPNVQFTLQNNSGATKRLHQAKHLQARSSLVGGIEDRYSGDVIFSKVHKIKVQQSLNTPAVRNHPLAIPSKQARCGSAFGFIKSRTSGFRERHESTVCSNPGLDNHNDQQDQCKR